MVLNYIQAKKLLTSQGKFYINLGLDRIKSILNILGNPQEKIKIIHIAGTNGKGSVSAIIANILKCSGYKTGLYTSPHLVEYTERIKINDEQISQKDFAKYIEKICLIADENKIELTEFEILTAVAFNYFADNNIDFAIIEVGLGGRYDATNVCLSPVLSIITSISLDHTDRLGNTIEQIAYEKAGIIKSNCPVIISANNKGFGVIKKIADEKKSRLIATNDDIDIIYKDGQNIAQINNINYEFPLLGLYQKQNLTLAVAAANYLSTLKYNINLKDGLSTVKWAARLEYIKDKNILIDGAHNPDAAIQLKKSLDYYFPKQKKLYIYSTINTKDYKTVAQILFEPDDEIYYYEFEHKNAVDYATYKNDVSWLKNIQKLNNLDYILKRQELKIVTGSLYMIGELYTKIR